MSHPDFILRVAKGEFKSYRRNADGHRDARRQTLYWTFDHRRLFCMREAGCQKVRVQVELGGHAFNEFASKGIEALGRRRSIQLC